MRLQDNTISATLSQLLSSSSNTTCSRASKSMKKFKNNISISIEGITQQLSSMALQPTFLININMKVALINLKVAWIRQEDLMINKWLKLKD